MKKDQLVTATERLLARSALDRAWRNTLFGVLGSPVLAGVWVITCARAREFEAGRVNPWSGPATPGWLVQLLYDHLWIALYATFGMIGLHVVFGVLVLIMFGLGTWGWGENRALHRRLGSDAIRNLRLTELFATWPELKVRAEAGPLRARRRLARDSAAAPLWALVRLVILALPVALAALTIALVWVALRT